MAVNIYRVRFKGKIVDGQIYPGSIWDYWETDDPQKAITYYLRGAEMAGMTVQTAMKYLAESEQWFDVERLEVVEKVQ